MATRRSTRNTPKKEPSVNVLAVKTEVKSESIEEADTTGSQMNFTDVSKEKDIPECTIDVNENNQNVEDKNRNKRKNEGSANKMTSNKKKMRLNTFKKSYSYNLASFTPNRVTGAEQSNHRPPFANPLALLNRFNPDLKAEVLGVTGSKPNKIYAATIKKDKSQFFGFGTNKKMAMQNAAAHALQFLEPMLFVSGVLDKWLNETYWNRLFHLETPSKREVDFTSDECWLEELNGKRPKPSMNKEQQPYLVSALIKDVDKNKKAESYLNELIPGSVECFESVPVDSVDGKKLFQMSFFLEGQIYSATSSSKENARRVIAAEILRKKFFIEEFSTKELENEKENLEVTVQTKLSKSLQNLKDSNNVKVFAIKDPHLYNPKNPIQFLVQCLRTTSLKWVERTDLFVMNPPSYTFVLEVNDKKYEGTCKSKKGAKAAAATKCLKDQFDLDAIVAAQKVVAA